MNDFIEFFMWPLIVIACAITALVALAVALGSYSCSQYESVTGKQTRFSGLECYINDGGKWYAWAEYKNRLVTRGTMTNEK